MSILNNEIKSTDQIQELISKDGLSNDAKNIIILLFPVLRHIEQISEDLNEIISINEETKTIKNILIGDEKKLREGNPVEGIVGNISEIKKAVKISEKTKEDKRVHTLEELIFFIKSINDENHLKIQGAIEESKTDIINIINKKEPWYKQVEHIKDIVLTCSILITAVLTILNIMDKI